LDIDSQDRPTVQEVCRDDTGSGEEVQEPPTAGVYVVDGGRQRIEDAQLAT
jgi:hypothetical protein